MTPLLRPGEVTLRLPSSHFCFAIMSFDNPLHATVQKMSGMLRGVVDVRTDTAQPSQKYEGQSGMEFRIRLGTIALTCICFGSCPRWSSRGTATLDGMQASCLLTD
jgi:hypothetical protein